MSAPPDFRVMFESMPGLHLMLSPSLDILACTDAYVAATMTPRDRLIGRNVFDAFPENPDDAASNSASSLRRSLMRVVEARVTDTMPVLKYDVRGADGTYEVRYWTPVNRPVLRADGSLHFIINSVEDVTASVVQSQATTLANQQLDRFFTLSLDLLCITGPDGRFRRINPAFAVLGYGEAELLATPFLELVHPDDVPATLEVVKELAAGKPAVHFENRFRCQDGSYRWLRWSSVDDGTGTLYAAARDVTADKAREAERAAESERLAHANTQLSEAREVAERSSRAKSDFLSLMSHELRTPLNSIIGFSELLLDSRFGEVNEKQTRYLTNVHQSGKHLLGLINDLLDLSKIEAGRMDVQTEPCSARQIVQEALATVQPLASAKQLELSIEGDGSPPVMADPVRLKQVIYNLLSNAIKFTPKAGQVTVRLEPGAAPHRLRIAVVDTGPGLSDADMQQLFRPFSQLANARAATGTGLGLALTRSLVELMGGVAGVESTPGQGSTFFVECPLVRAPVAEGHPDGDLGQRLVLVIDDDRAGRELIDAVLREAGFRTLMAASGEQGMALARLNLPDVIVLDVFLPGLDGWEVLRLLHEDATTRHIPVVMATVSDDRGKAFGLGAVEHLVKPIDRGLLLEALARRSFTAPGAGRATRVLVVDDDPAHLELVTSALTPLGIEVTTRDTGTGGLDAAVHGKFDLLLLDLVLPDISGVEIVHQIRNSPAKGLPIILVTAHEISGAERARLRGDVQAVFQKGGSTLERLVDEVTSMVRANA